MSSSDGCQHDVVLVVVLLSAIAELIAWLLAMELVATSQERESEGF